MHTAHIPIADTHTHIQTSFFVSIDSMLYSFGARDPDSSDWSTIDTLIIASLGGAIILHVCACELLLIHAHNCT